jgi:soluble lytic murein transglycosylase-like protein
MTRILAVSLTVLAVALAAAAPASSNPRSYNISVIRSVFGANASSALRVAHCESRYNSRAVGSAGERGLFQIHPVHRSWVNWGAMFNPWVNARAAYRLSRGGTNWSHWTCKPW